MADQLPVVRVVKTNNHDIASMMRRLDRMLVEVGRSQSSNVSALLAFDNGRVKQFLSMLKSYKAFAMGVPFMDAPETNPILIEVACYGAVVPVENDSAWDLCQLIDTTILEIASMDSSRISSNLLPYDSVRMDAYFTRMEQLLAHITAAEPVDAPESSPREVNSGEGTTGIKYTASK